MSLSVDEIILRYALRVTSHVLKSNTDALRAIVDENHSQAFCKYCGAIVRINIKTSSPTPLLNPIPAAGHTARASFACCASKAQMWQNGIGFTKTCHKHIQLPHSTLAYPLNTNAPTGRCKPKTHTSRARKTLTQPQ